MSSAGSKSAERSFRKSVPNPFAPDKTDPFAVPNDLSSHLTSHGDIFSENDPNNLRPQADNGGAAATDLGIATRVDSQFNPRDQSISRAAQAAGAQRNENDADLLGSTPTTAKRRSAARALLG